MYNKKPNKNLLKIIANQRIDVKQNEQQIIKV